MISVIVPTYNEEANIVKCLKSLCNQTLPRSEYEIIVVDGNSKDRTRELAKEYADMVMIQTSKKVGGARNDGVMRAKGDIIATTDADCILPPNWLEVIKGCFEDGNTVQLYGPVFPLEDGIKNRFYLACANNFSRLGYYTRLFFWTLGCNTAFDKESFIRAGMYRCIDAGDDVEIAVRMRKLGQVKFVGKLKVGFSMRRYQQFGLFNSLYEWLRIVASGGESDKHSYSRRDYSAK